MLVRLTPNPSSNIYVNIVNIIINVIVNISDETVNISPSATQHVNIAIITGSRPLVLLSSEDYVFYRQHPQRQTSSVLPYRNISGSVFLTRACSQSECCARHLHCTTVCTTQSEPTLRRADLHSVAGTLTATHETATIRQKSPRKHPTNGHTQYSRARGCHHPCYYIADSLASLQL